MLKWEYKLVTTEIDWEEASVKPAGIDQGRISNLGNEGWELVGIAPVTGPLEDGAIYTVEIQYVFKRPRAEKIQATPAPAQVNGKKKGNPLSPVAAARIQRTDVRKPESKTSKSGFAPRAQRAAAKQPAATGKRS